jgi:hypothetical protein
MKMQPQMVIVSEPVLREIKCSDIDGVFIDFDVEFG